MMDIALEILVAEAVKRLTFTDGAKRGYCQSLGLSAGEDRAAVSAGQNTDITPDRADFGYFPSVRTNAFIQDLRTHDFLVYSCIFYAVFSH